MYVTLDTVGEKINVLECFNRAVENTQLKHRKENGKYSQKKKKIDIEYVTKKVSQYPVKFLIYVEFKYVTKMFKVLSRRVSVLHSWHYLGINKSIIYFAVLCVPSCVRLFETLWTVVRQAPLPMGFPWQRILN